MSSFITNSPTKLLKKRFLDLLSGSSKLTSSGLTRQQEFNVEISYYGVKEEEEYFDNLEEKSKFVNLLQVIQ